MQSRRSSQNTWRRGLLYMLSETSGDWVITKANSRAAKIAKDKADVKQKENDEVAEIEE